MKLKIQSIKLKGSPKHEIPMTREGLQRRAGILPAWRARQRERNDALHRSVFASSPSNIQHSIASWERSAELQLCAKQPARTSVNAPSWSSALLPGVKLKGSPKHEIPMTRAWPSDWSLIFGHSLEL